MAMKILVTGGAGFIGSNFVRYLLKNYPDYRIVNLDDLTYAGNLASLRDVLYHPHHQFVKGNICDRELVSSLFPVDAIVHFAAESHVDRSIADAGIFLRSNIIGTHVLLEAARTHSVRKFIQVSTDEVYGSLGETGAFTETTKLAPNSPYSASKAGADLLVRSYIHTYGLPAVITRCSNNYGPYQYPEKLIPRMITRALLDQELPVYGDGRHVRDWLHVWDHCVAIDLVLHRGVPGEVYNIGGRNEWTNLAMVEKILSLLAKSEKLIRFVPDRPGHDRRYAIDSSKIRAELGWRPQYDFDQGLAETVAWYKANQGWWSGLQQAGHGDCEVWH